MALLRPSPDRSLRGPWRRDAPARRRSPPARRLIGALRSGLAAAVVLGAVAAADWALRFPMLTSAVGPISYLFAAHPRSASARLRNTLVGQAVAIGAAIGAVAAFGLWHAPSVVAVGHTRPAQVAATALAVGVTVLVLQLIGAHHVPGAATAVLITTGLAPWGRPLAGLVAGVAAVAVLGPVTALVPLGEEHPA